MEQQKLDRISELARKSRTVEGLTDAERAEQMALRQEYIESMKRSLRAQLDNIDAIIVPVGGGGLISGIAYTAKQIRPSVKVYGVQAAGAPSMFNSISGGAIECLDSVQTIADGIAVKTPGDETFEICNKYLDDIVAVDDDEIAQTVLYLMERCKIVTEGAGAAAVAAIMGHKFECRGKVAAVLSGGNIDVTMLSRIIEKGMLKAGRMIKLRVVMEDKPGQLTLTSRIIAECGGNVVQVHHDRSCVELGINHALLEVSVETLSLIHI